MSRMTSDACGPPEPPPARTDKELRTPSHNTTLSARRWWHCACRKTPRCGPPRRSCCSTASSARPRAPTT